MHKFLALLLLLSLGLLSCDDNNYFTSLGDTSSNDYLMEEARLKVDQKEYTAALAIIDKITTDSNEYRILWTSALLGSVGLGLLDIVANILPDEGSSGTDNFLDSFDEAIVFGTGAERQTRLAALEESIQILAGAPNPNTGTKNLACIFAGLLAKPIITEGRAAVDAANANLESINAQATGAGTNADECPGISEFETNLQTIVDVQANIADVLATVAECPILDLAGTDLNTIEQSINKLNENADKGCQEIVCSGPICEALKLSCVSSLIDTSGNPQAGDGEIATCEIIQNCTDPTSCFGSF